MIKSYLILGGSSSLASPGNSIFQLFKIYDCAAKARNRYVQPETWPQMPDNLTGTEKNDLTTLRLP